MVPSVQHININHTDHGICLLIGVILCSSSPRLSSFSKVPTYVSAYGELKTLDSTPKPSKPTDWTRPLQYQQCPTWKPIIAWLHCKQNLIHRNIHEKVSRKVHPSPPFKWRLTADMKLAFVFNFIPYDSGVVAGSSYLYTKGNIFSVDMKHPSICKT